MRRCTRPIVAQALITSAAVPAEWSVGRADPGRGRQGLGVFRVTGSARVGGEPSAGSLILKVLPATKGSPTRWNYPMREPLACTRLRRVDRVRVVLSDDGHVARDHVLDRVAETVGDLVDHLVEQEPRSRKPCTSGRPRGSPSSC